MATMSGKCTPPSASNIILIVYSDWPRWCNLLMISLTPSITASLHNFPSKYKYYHLHFAVPLSSPQTSPKLPAAAQGRIQVRYYRHESMARLYSHSTTLCLCVPSILQPFLVSLWIYCTSSPTPFTPQLHSQLLSSSSTWKLSFHCLQIIWPLSLHLHLHDRLGIDSQGIQRHGSQEGYILHMSFKYCHNVHQPLSHHCPQQLNLYHSSVHPIHAWPPKPSPDTPSHCWLSIRPCTSFARCPKYFVLLSFCPRHTSPLKPTPSPPQIYHHCYASLVIVHQTMFQLCNMSHVFHFVLPSTQIHLTTKTHPFTSPGPPSPCLISIHIATTNSWYALALLIVHQTIFPLCELSHVALHNLAIPIHLIFHSCSYSMVCHSYNCDSNLLLHIFKINCLTLLLHNLDPAPKDKPCWHHLVSDYEWVDQQKPHWGVLEALADQPKSSIPHLQNYSLSETEAVGHHISLPNPLHTPLIPPHQAHLQVADISEHHAQSCQNQTYLQVSGLGHLEFLIYADSMPLQKMRAAGWWHGGRYVVVTICDAH